MLVFHDDTSDVKRRVVVKSTRQEAQKKTLNLEFKKQKLPYSF